MGRMQATAAMHAIAIMIKSQLPPSIRALESMIDCMRSRRPGRWWCRTRVLVQVDI